jgi:hypothetical protein
MNSPNYPTTPTPIILADGKERHLRYSLSAVKRIKAKFGKTFTDILAHPPEEFLPEVLMEGLTEKEGLTEAVLMDDLLTGPMIEYAQLCFVEAFFGVQQRQTIDALLARNRDLLEKAIGTQTAMPLAVTPIVQ